MTALIREQSVYLVSVLSKSQIAKKFKSASPSIITHYFILIQVLSLSGFYSKKKAPSLSLYESSE